MNDELGAAGRLSAVADGVPPRPEISADDYAELRAALRRAPNVVWTDNQYDARMALHAAASPSVIAALLADRDRKTEALQGMVRPVTTKHLSGCIHLIGGMACQCGFNERRRAEIDEALADARAALRGSGEEAGRGK